MKKPIRGTTRQCLDHYSQDMPTGVSRCTEARKPLADFTKVTLGTVERWMLRNMLPVGEPLLRLRYFLREHGYIIEEMEGISNDVVRISESIVFEAITVDDVVSLVGLSKNHFFGILLGKRSTTKKVLDDIVRIYQTTQKETNAARAEFRKAMGIHLSVQAEPDIELAMLRTFARTKLSEEDSSIKEILIASFAGVMRSIGPLVQLMSSDSFTPEDRRRIRKLVGENEFFFLSTEINRLQSETARQQYRRPGQPQATVHQDRI